MQDLKVTLVQATQVWENKQANFEHFEELLSSLEETDVLVLPEMFHTGFTMNAEQYADSMENSEAINWLKTIASKNKVAIYTSFIARENGSFFNRGIFMEPSGNYSIYDKRKLFTLAGEEIVFKPGYVKTQVKYKGWKLQFQICYDLRFPEIARNGLDENGKPEYDVLFYVANWPERRVTHWKSLLISRAIENQSYVVGVNRVGVDGKGLTYSGDSAVINAYGDKISKTVAYDESVETVTLSWEDLQETRSQLQFLKDI